MSIGIITPHYNNFEGLKQIHVCLLKQTNLEWEWVVIDDLSNAGVRSNLKSYFNGLSDIRIQLILNDEKSNASVCRNIGAMASKFNRLVFLDSDDFISEDFVQNRKIRFEDFAVFGNYQIINSNGNVFNTEPIIKSSYLDEFLSARFLWQTSCVLWDKTFFNDIGKFHPLLPRLQDVELTIRALQHSNCFVVIDNPVDFFYNVKPIRERKNFVKPVCESVRLFIFEFLDSTKLDMLQKRRLSNYYYLCTKYLERSGSVVDIVYVRKNLSLFYEKKYISFSDYVLGDISLKLYTYKLLTGTTFLKVNRYLFKKIK